MRRATKIENLLKKPWTPGTGATLLEECVTALGKSRKHEDRRASEEEELEPEAKGKGRKTKGDGREEIKDALEHAEELQEELEDEAEGEESKGISQMLADRAAKAKPVAKEPKLAKEEGEKNKNAAKKSGKEGGEPRNKDKMSTALVARAEGFAKAWAP